MKILIIGGGISGLVAACNLQLKGHQTTLIEKNNFLGGRLNKFKSNETDFCNGPSWYWMDDIFQEVWDNLHIDSRDRYKLNKLNPQFKIINRTQEIIIPSEIKEIKEVFEKIQEKSSNNLDLFISENKYKYNLTKKFMKYPNLSIFEYLNLNTLNILKYNIFDSYRTFFKKRFSNKILQQILEWPSYFIGSNPNKISSLFNILTYSYLNDGTYIPENGMYSIIEMLEKHYISLGGKINLNNNLRKVNLYNNQIVSVDTNINRYYCDFVISSIDYNYFENLLPKKMQTYSKYYWNNIKTCPSALIFHLKLDINIDKLNIHNLFIDNNIDSYFLEYDITSFPPFYINTNIKNKTLFILVPISDRAYTESEIDLCLDYITCKIYNLTRIDINNHIENKVILTNKDYKNIFNSFKDNAYGISCENLQIGPFRPSIKSLKINNLFYCGQSTNPGPGLPPCALSGLIVSNYLCEYIHYNMFQRIISYINHYFIIILSNLIMFFNN